MIKEYLFPKTIDEAIKLLQRSDTRSAAVAGGTYLNSRQKTNIESLIDINRIGLDYVKNDNESIMIGAATKLATIAKEVNNQLLRKASLTAADSTIINQISIGGNIAITTNWTNLPPALICLQAKLKIRTPDTKIIDYEEYINYKKNDNKPILIEEVIIPKCKGNCVHYFEKFAATKTDYPWLVLAIHGTIVEGKINNIIIAINGATSKTTRLTDLEKIVISKKTTEITPEVIQEGLANVHYRRDYRFERWYQEELLRNLLYRGITSLS